MLEVGSGTGQHAVHFAEAMPQLRWQCSEQPEQLEGIQQWLHEAALPNTTPPLALQVSAQPWPVVDMEALFTANTLHIMSWPEVEQFFTGLDAALKPTAKLVVYGPFNYQGQFTSDSNAQFDQWLKSQAAHWAIRDFEAVNALAGSVGFSLDEDIEMPANNRCLVWSRSAS